MKPPGPNDRLTHLEVEPLSDIAWQRIEKNLWAALDRADEAPTRLDVARRSRSRLALYGGGAAALVAAAAAIALLALGGDDDARGPAFRGTSRVVTEEAASAVSIGDVALTVAPRSAVLVDDQRASGVLVVLERGHVDLQVAPRGERPPLTVQAGEVRIEVVGTKFGVSREGDRAAVVVHEGVVEVIEGGDRTRVAAGERWPAVRAAPSDDAEMTFSPDEVARAASPEPRRREPRVRRDDRPSDKERYELAARLEASDPDAARAIYRELSASGGAWAANALYALARLEADLGDHDRARGLAERYLRRFPAGANAADARTLLER